VLNVDSLDNGAVVEVRAVESDGDYKAAQINASASASADDVISTGTGNGYVFQERLSDLATQGSGDGSLAAIDQIEVVVEDANAQVTITGLDVERKDMFDVGEVRRDTDNDGTVESTTIQEENSGGTVELTAVDSMDALFDDAVIHDFAVQELRYEFADLTDSDDYQVEWSSADEYNYPHKLEIHGRLSIPAAIDLTHSGLSFEDSQNQVSSRYATVEVAEGVGSQEFSNISSWTSKKDLYTSKGTNVTLDSTVQVDTEYAFHGVYLFQDGERDDVEPSQNAGGGGFWGGGNPITGFINWMVAGVFAVAGMLGISRARG
jgi:hypothetical protein